MCFNLLISGRLGGLPGKHFTLRLLLIFFHQKNINFMFYLINKNQMQQEHIYKKLTI